jgi:excinuclease UvrABC ATPase subunit
MANDRIVVRGAREHNPKSIDVEIPRDHLVVITGLSGSDKSSLAFDTIYAEGQRRYVESPSPAISIEQKTTSKNPRSTVGTVTEVYDYLREVPIAGDEHRFVERTIRIAPLPAAEVDAARASILAAIPARTGRVI